MILGGRTRNCPRAARRRAWGRAAAALSGAFAAGGLSGAHLVHDGGTREWIVQGAYRILHAGRYARALLAGTPLETIRIDIGGKERLRINASRDAALESGVLFREDEAWHDAALGYDGVAVPVELRLKGLMDDHRSTDKWSYRIKLPDGHAFDGMTDFAIQHPKTRAYLAEWEYRESARAEDLLAPRYSFVQVVINGTESGIYAAEEHFTSDAWLEKQGRRDGVILRMDDTEIWRRKAELGTHLRTLDPTAFATNQAHEYRAKRIERNEAQRSQRDAAVRLLVDFTEGRRPGSEVFDVERTSRFLALHELWSSDHVLGPPNARFYYNGITGRLEPIAGDAEPDFGRGPLLVSLPPYHHDGYDVLGGVFWPPLYLQDPLAMEAYVRELVRICQPEHLERLRERMGEQSDRYLGALRREYPQVDTSWDRLAARQAQLRAMLNVSRTVVVYGQRDERGTRLGVANVLGLPVEVLSIEVDGGPAAPARSALRDGNDAVAMPPARQSVVLPLKRWDEPMRYVRFELPASGVPEGDASGTPVVRVRTRILGTEREVVVEAKMGPQMRMEQDAVPAPPTVAEALDRWPFLEAGAGPDELRIREGTWEVTEDLVLPRGVTLAAGPGTVLRFAPDALMLARGPLLFEGDEDAPVVLEPSGESWPGLAVLGAGGPSTWRHVAVRATRGIDRNGWFLTGGVTFYESPVRIAGGRFTGSVGEDALNTIRTTLDLRESVFVECASDALDADFCHAVISSCVFADTEGDAIDASGSRVQAYDVAARRIGDKAFSAGEDSQVMIDRATIEQARFGIVSKDLSFVLAERVEIRKGEVGLGAFVKKPAFGPAAINAPSVTLEGVEHPTLVQTDSWVRINGQKVFGSELDVQTLYAVEEASAAVPEPGGRGGIGRHRIAEGPSP